MKEEIAYEYVPSETQSSDILRIWTECPPIDGEVHQVTPVPDGTEPKSTDRSENPKVKTKKGRAVDVYVRGDIAYREWCKKKKGKKKPWIREALDKSVRAELKY